MPVLDDPLFPVTPASVQRLRNRIAAARLSAELGCEVTPNPDFPGTFDARDPAPGVWLLTGTLDELRAEYDVIIVDAPPVLPVADALAIAPACDGAILVVRYGKTRRDQLSQTTAALRKAEVDVLGTVLNRAPRRGRESRR